MSRDRELKEQQLPWSLLFYPVGKSTEFCSVLYFLTPGGGEGDWRWEGGTKHTTTRVTVVWISTKILGPEASEDGPRAWAGP